VLGWLYSGPASGGVGLDQLVPFGVAMLESVDSFVSERTTMLSICVI
jgi:hypothetical protein